MIIIVRFRLWPWVRGILCLCKSSGTAMWPYKTLDGWRWPMWFVDLEYLQTPIISKYVSDTEKVADSLSGARAAVRVVFVAAAAWIAVKTLNT